MIEILIPTYNRSNELQKNLKHLNALINDENLKDKFRIIISNNKSTDNTVEMIGQLKAQLSFEIIVINQDENIGLEKNAVSILDYAKSEYVIFLGDDDFLPSGYLGKLFEISESRQFGVVIPGFSALMPDGEVKVGRKDFISRSHNSGFKAVLDFSHHGHQLSGLFFKRKGVIDAYKYDENNRNIYLFIFFISHVMKNESSFFAPEYQVLVSQGNEKNWSYDDSGLLTEIFKNFNALYPKSIIKRSRLCLAVMVHQKWRMRFGRNPLNVLKSFVHLLKSQELTLLIKIMLPFLYPYFYISSIIEYYK